MDEQTLSYYDTHSSEVARRYEATAEGISSLGERVLEIGSGSGRDAVRLMALGVEVDTVEPSAGMRQQALAEHPELSGKVHDGFLPGGLPRQLREKYDGILLSAVIMHIPDAGERCQRGSKGCHLQACADPGTVRYRDDGVGFRKLGKAGRCRGSALR